MFPEAFEPLSFDEHVIVFRVNLYCAAIILAGVALLAGSCGWQLRALALSAGIALAFVARHTEPLLRRLDAALAVGRWPGEAERHHSSF